jgi:hypothetical protein
MTLGQAAQRGIARLRRPSWDPSKSIELALSRDPDGNLDGYVGPWVKLRDAGTEQNVIIFTVNEDEDWEPIEDAAVQEPETGPELVIEKPKDEGSQ